MASTWSMEAVLFSDAEGTEDQVENVVGGGGAGDFVERAQGCVEIEQEHLVRHSSRDGVLAASSEVSASVTSF